MLKITSRDNPRLKQAGRVRDGKVKNLIFVEGLRLAEEALRSGLEIKEVFIAESFTKNERGKQFLDRISERKILTVEVSESALASLVDTKNSQGVVLIVAKPKSGKFKIEASLAEIRQIPLVVLLHQINNPSNLGAILRTAEAVDAAGVILTKDSADVFSPKSLRGAMGAAFRLPLWKDANFFEALDWAFKLNLITAAADVKAEKSYLEIDWNAPRLLIFGSEAHGLSEKEMTEVDETFKIPMENAVESLNLAVSCGVILFEARRQIDGKRNTQN